MVDVAHQWEVSREVGVGALSTCRTVVPGYSDLADLERGLAFQVLQKRLDERHRADIMVLASNRACGVQAQDRCVDLRERLEEGGRNIWTIVADDERQVVKAMEVCGGVDALCKEDWVLGPFLYWPV